MSDINKTQMKFIIITGISGAGKSNTVKILEDIGFFCVDNLPPALIPKFAEFYCQTGGKMDKIALVVDIRGRYLFNDLFPELEAVKNMGFSYEILFLEANDKVLVKRFKETRRIHPLSPEGRLIKGIKEERKFLKEIKSKATHIIDTSYLTPRQLRNEIEDIFVKGKRAEGIIINVLSFGFKYGIPIDCDMVFDVRFIKNPYYIESMKNLTGKDELVKDYVLEHESVQKFLNKVYELIESLIPNYIEEGKSQLVIGIGCTGGRHRSVTIADSIYKFLQNGQHRVILDHRDIEKDSRSVVK